MKASDTAIYTLNCDRCGQSYYHDKPFPKPQYCAICFGTYQIGMRKVVEWLERAKKVKVPKYQLKEWGIELGAKEDALE